MELQPAGPPGRFNLALFHGGLLLSRSPRITLAGVMPGWCTERPGAATSMTMTENYIPAAAAPMEMRKGNAGSADVSQLAWKAEYAYPAGMQAFIYGFPYVYNAKLRHDWVTQARDPAVVPYAAVNCFWHAARVLDAANRDGGCPNNDTLYSLAWLDLGGEGEVTVSHVRVGQDDRLDHPGRAGKHLRPSRSRLQQLQAVRRVQLRFTNIDGHGARTGSAAPRTPAPQPPSAVITFHSLGLLFAPSLICAAP